MARRRRAGRAGYLLVAALTVVSAAGGLYIAARDGGQPARASGAPVPLLGSSVLSKSDLAADTSQFGPMPVVRVYYPGLPPDNAWSTGMAAANHSAVVVSFKALPTTILSGRDDAALRHFFDTAPSGHPIYWTYYHEMEDNIAAGQFRLPDYKAAWARVAAIAAAAHNTSLHSILILMSWDLVKASHRNWRNYLPGGHIIKVLGWDAYPMGSATNQNPQLEPPTGFIGPAIAASRSVGLPYAFPEFGLSTPRGRPGWLNNVGRYILRSGALFATYFNGSRQYPTLRLTDSASVAIWRSFVAQSRDGTPVPIPSATPSAQPTPTPSPTGRPGPRPGAMLSGLKLSFPHVTLATEAAERLSFRLLQNADVTVCVLNARGAAVTRLIARPGRKAGQVTIRYLGLSSRTQVLPVGDYKVLVIANNSRGSGTAEVSLRVSPLQAPWPAPSSTQPATSHQ